MIEKTYIGAEEYLHDIWRLAAEVGKGSWRADRLVALWRGGAPVGVAVHEFLKHVCGWNPRHSVLKCSSYTGLGEAAAEVVFEGAGTILEGLVAGEKVLVVDDVFDTGKTAEAVKKMLDPLGVEMRFAAVYYKPGKNETRLEPDYFVKDVSDDWIVFPHELEGLSRSELERKDPFLAELTRG